MGTFNEFSDCSGLTNVFIDNSVTKIGYYAFSGCSSLTSITIPNSVTKIGDYAFSGCSGLTGVTIPNSVTKIGSCTFSGCSNLTSIIIPNSVGEIDNYAFSGCSKLKELTIEDGTETLKMGYNDYVEPNNEYGEGLFYDCPLTTLYLGRNVSYYISRGHYEYSFLSYTYSRKSYHQQLCDRDRQ